MHLFNLQGVFAPFDDIVIEFIPKRQSSNLRAWKFCYRVKVQPIETQPSKIEYENREEEQTGTEIKEPKHPGGKWNDKVGISSSFCVCKCDSENVSRKVPVQRYINGPIAVWSPADPSHVSFIWKQGGCTEALRVACTRLANDRLRAPNRFSWRYAEMHRWQMVTR